MYTSESSGNLPNSCHVLTLERVPNEVKNDLLPETREQVFRGSHNIRKYENALRINISRPFIRRVTIDDVLRIIPRVPPPK